MSPARSVSVLFDSSSAVQRANPRTDSWPSSGGVAPRPDQWFPPESKRRIITVGCRVEVEMVAVRIAIRAFGHEQGFSRCQHGRKVREIRTCCIVCVRQEKIVDGVTVATGFIRITRTAPQVRARGVRLQRSNPRFSLMRGVSAGSENRPRVGESNPAILR